MTLMNGAGGLPSTADINAVGTPVVTVQNNPSPSGNQGRIAIAAPALTNDPLRNSFYKDWLYAVVITPNGGIAGVYQTKDHGVNWALIQIPAYDVNHHLDTGELVEVMPTHRAAPMPMNLLYPHRRHLSRRLQVFADWLEQLLKRKVL